MLNAKSDWFRVYKVSVHLDPLCASRADTKLSLRQDFGISAEAYNVTFLRSRIILSCSKGFQIMDLAQSVFMYSGVRDRPKAFF